MWQKFKEQIPAVLLIAVIVVGVGYALYQQQQTVQEAQSAQQEALAKQRADFEAKLQQATDTNRRQIDSLDKLLKDAIEKRSADVFMTEAEVEKLNSQKVDQLAEAIAKKVQPYNPLPKSPEEAEKMQNEQVDKVSARMADRIQPILTEMSKDQNLTRESIDRYSNRISDQVSKVLTSEMARNQVLNNNLQETQSVADDAMKLSHEITALYLSSFQDKGLITRLLTLPANVVKDATNLSIVNSSERKKVEEDLMAKMNDIDKRLEIIRATQAPK